MKIGQLKSGLKRWIHSDDMVVEISSAEIFPFSEDFGMDVGLREKAMAGSNCSNFLVG